MAKSRKRKNEYEKNLGFISVKQANEYNSIRTQINKIVEDVHDSIGTEYLIPLKGNQVWMPNTFCHMLDKTVFFKSQSGSDSTFWYLTKTNRSVEVIRLSPYPKGSCIYIGFNAPKEKFSRFKNWFENQIMTPLSDIGKVESDREASSKKYQTIIFKDYKNNMKLELVQTLLSAALGTEKLLEAIELR